MQDKILIMGCGGMLGHKVVDIFKKKDNKKLSINMIGSQDYDLRHKHEIDNLAYDIRREKYKYVINCVGMLRQRLSKNPTASEIYATLMLNSYLPHKIAECCNLIHITTDCVFSGTSTRPYKETDEHTEMDLYGRTKSMGEPQNAMNLRTSIVGPEITGRNLSLYEWFMSQDGPVKGFTNHLWNGVTTSTLANIIYNIVDRGIIFKGVRHILSNTISKYYLLKLFNKRRLSRIDVIPSLSDNTVNRTLDTIYPEFLNQFDIPAIEDQVLNM